MKSFLKLSLGLAMIIATATVQAAPVLTLSNGDFHSYAGPGAPGTANDPFTQVNPTSWTGGGGLVFITNYANINSTNYLDVYGPTPGVHASIPNNPFPNTPSGSSTGYFVEADGNPTFESSISFQLHGLTVGQQYQLSFWQAAGQQFGFSSATTNQWYVGLGTPGSFFSGANQLAPTYSDSFAAANGGVAASPLMNVPNEGVHGWEQVTVFLTADNADDVLTFLAWGNQGSTANVPPMAFLDLAGNGAEVSGVPEPASLSLIVVGMVGVGAYKVRRRRSNPATV